MLSMSTRTHDYGRLTRDEAETGYYNRDFGGEHYGLSAAVGNLHLGETESQNEDFESDEESESGSSSEQDDES